jgi:TolA protein
MPKQDRPKPEVVQPSMQVAANLPAPASGAPFIAVTEPAPVRPKPPVARRVPKPAPRKKPAPLPPQPTVIAQVKPLRDTFTVPKPAPEKKTETPAPIPTETPAHDEKPEPPIIDEAAKAEAEEKIALALAEAAHKAEEEGAALAREQELQRQEAERKEAQRQETLRQAQVQEAIKQAEETARQQALALEAQKQAEQLAVEQAREDAAVETRRQAEQQEALRQTQQAETRRQAEALEARKLAAESEASALEAEARKAAAEEAARQQAAALAKQQQDAQAAAATAAARPGENGSAAGVNRTPTIASDRTSDKKQADVATTGGGAGSNPAARAPVESRRIITRPSERAAPPARITRTNDLCRQKAEGWYRSDIQVDIYAAAWRTMVRTNAPFEPLQAAKTAAYENPTVTVAIHSDGSVDSVTFNRSSGIPELDDAIRSAIEKLAPYDPFPPQLEADCDVIEFPSIWSINRGLRLTWRGQ